MTLRDDLSLGDMEKIGRRSQIYDPQANAWRSSAFEGAIESVNIVVTEWAVLTPKGEPAPLSPKGLRSLDVKLGRRIVKAISDHVGEQGVDDEDLESESGG